MSPLPAFKPNETIYCRFTGEALTVICCDGVIAIVVDGRGETAGRIVGELTRRTARYSVQHTKCIGSRADEGVSRPFWYQLEAYADLNKALHRARNYALDNGGYVCVKDVAGTIVYGTDPAALDRAITLGINHDFTAPAGRV